MVLDICGALEGSRTSKGSETLNGSIILNASWSVKRSCRSWGEITYGLQPWWKRVAKIWLGVCEKIWENCSLWGEYTCLALDFASGHQSCTLASQRTTFTNRVNCLLYPWYLICSQGKFFHNRENCSCNRFIIIVYGRVIFVYRLVVLLIYQGGNGFTHVSNIGFTHVLGSGFTHVLGCGFPWCWRRFHIKLCTCSYLMIENLNKWVIRPNKQYQSYGSWSRSWKNSVHSRLLVFCQDK